MTGVVKGIRDIKKKADEIAAYRSKDRIKYINLRPNESATLRFLTDGDDLISAQFHNVQEMTPKGNFWTKKYCTNDGTCKYCAEGLANSENLFLWAYCYSISHTQQNPALETNAEAQKWVRTKQPDGSFVYLEAVNAPRVFRTTVGAKGAYKNNLIQLYNTHGTFLDRDYKLSRVGNGLDTTYSLNATKEGAMTDEIKKVRAELPRLADVVSGKVTSFTAEAEEETESDADFKKLKSAVKDTENEEDFA